MIVLLIFLFALVITIQFMMEENVLTMNSFFRNIRLNLWSIIIGVVVLILLWIIFRGCNNGPSVKEDRREVDSLTAVIQVNEEAHKIYMERKEKEIDSLQNITRKTQLEANKARQEIRRIIAKGSGIIAVNRDPIVPEKNFDSLAMAFNDLSQTATDYISLVDTLTNYYQARLDGKDSIISRQLALYSDLRSAQIELSGKYYAMEKNYIRAEKKRKINRDLNRGLAAAVLIMGTIIAKK